MQRSMPERKRPMVREVLLPFVEFNYAGENNSTKFHEFFVDRNSSKFSSRVS